MTITSYRDLVVWHRAMALTESVYRLTESFPRSEQYGLTIQLRRAAVSIPSNIAEGHSRRTGHYLHHLNIASGSAAELETQLDLSHRLHLVPKNLVIPVIDDAAEVGRMLHGLAASVATARKSSRSLIPDP